MKKVLVVLVSCFTICFACLFTGCNCSGDNKETEITGEYHIYFNLGEHNDTQISSDAGLSYNNDMRMYYKVVKYNSAIELFIPVSQYAVFKCWKNVRTGEIFDYEKFTFKEDVYLRAEWDETDTPFN